MHEGAAAPSSLRPGLGLRRAGVSVRKRCLRTSSRAKRGPDCQKTLIISLGMHEGAAAPSYLIRSGGVYAARLEALWASKSASPTADGKIEDFDAAPSERPRWPLPLSFFFSPQPRLRRVGVPVLRGPLGRPRTSSRAKRGLRLLAPGRVSLARGSRPAERMFRSPRYASRVRSANL